MNQLYGYCLCKAIAFSIPTPSRFDVCHCVDCRRWHGAPAIGIDSTEVTLLNDAPTLTWFNSSTMAERGFCSTCGTSLFYRLKSNRSKWSVYMGSLTKIPQNIPLGYQSFLGQKLDFYAIVSPR
ncbi:MAG: GFA family protein [Cyanobacteria bacterium P01_F01_bin.86]